MAPSPSPLPPAHPSTRLWACPEPVEGCPSAPLTSSRSARLAPGFTLIEILLVITIIGILLTLAQPSYQRAVIAAKEATLKENLFVLRDLIDQYFADNNSYPESLSVLVDRRYLRRVPKDPITGSENWVAVYLTDEQGQQGGIFDVKSGSDRIGSDGTRYSDW